MKLSDWLRRHNVKRSEFARRIGVSPGAVTQICREDGAWPSRETAERIVVETGGAVTPNDFFTVLAVGGEENDMSNSVTETIEAFARGEIVVVTDDDDRENEGDMIVAASHLHDREDGLHHPQRLRHRLRAADRPTTPSGCI